VNPKTVPRAREKSKTSEGKKTAGSTSEEKILTGGRGKKKNENPEGSHWRELKKRRADRFEATRSGGGEGAKHGHYKRPSTKKWNEPRGGEHVREQDRPSKNVGFGALQKMNPRQKRKAQEAL